MERGSPQRVQAPIEEPAARRALDALVAEHLPAMRARASRLCRSRFDPDDVVQDALVRACRGYHQVADPARSRAWLLAIVTNTFIDLMRRRRRRPEPVPLVVEVATPEPAEPAPWDAIASDDLRAAIERLPQDVRDTYRMFALEGRDYVTISAVQQIPKATVASRLYRARKRLLHLLLPAARDARDERDERDAREGGATRSRSRPRCGAASAASPASRTPRS